MKSFCCFYRIYIFLETLQIIIVIQKLKTDPADNNNFTLLDPRIRPFRPLNMRSIIVDMTLQF